MDKRELAYAKQTLFSVKDWDAFQDALRFWAKLIKSVTLSDFRPEVKKA